MISMVFDRVAAQTGNLSWSFEMLKRIFTVAFAENDAVVVKVSALNFVVFTFDQGFLLDEAVNEMAL